MTSSKYQVTGKAQRPNDLVGRTFEFAQSVRRFVNYVPRSAANFEGVRQLIRASGSVAANYLESQEGLSRKDFFYRIKVCRKEARECGLWLRLIDVGAEPMTAQQRNLLVAESDELKRIFSAIAGKDDGE